MDSIKVNAKLEVIPTEEAIAKANQDLEVQDPDKTIASQILNEALCGDEKKDTEENSK